jgi:nucleoside-diphosphate-sugar epimerase
MNHAPQAGFEDALWPSLTAVVFGGSGAIGHFVVESLLRRGARVRVLARHARPGAAEGRGVEWHAGDLEDPPSLAPALKGCDVLFHCAAPYPRSHFHRDRQLARALAMTQGWLEAARSFVPAELLTLPPGHLRLLEIEQAEGAARVAQQQPERLDELRRALRSPELLESALAGRLNASLHPPLAETTALAGLKRIVYVSSVTTIGRPRGRPRDGRAAGVTRGNDQGNGGAILRQDPSAWANESDRHDRIADSSPYFVMKEEMEAAVSRAAVEGMPIVIGNPTFCLDAYDAVPTSGRLLIALAKGAMPVYLPGILNVVATRDVGEGLVNAATLGRTGQRYILGGENLTARDFFTRAARIAGVRPPARAVPLPLAEAMAWISEVVNLVFPQSWPRLPVSGVQMIRHSQPLDCRLAHEELRMPKTPLETAISDALRWFKENGYL